MKTKNNRPQENVPAPETKPTVTPPQGKTSEQQKPLPKKAKQSKKQTLPPLKRFNADVGKGLTDPQIQERVDRGMVNKTVKKYSKSYRSIFIGNICTFFNLLCLLAALALVLAGAPISQFVFVLIFLCNILVSIVQEIRAKRKIDKLSI